MFQNLFKTMSRTLYLQQKVFASTLQPLSTTLGQVEKLINLPVDHFLINNLIKDEHDISSFALKKADKMKRVLTETAHPILAVAEELFTENLTLNRDHVDQLIAQNTLNLGGVVLLLVARCLETIPSFKSDQSENNIKSSKFFKQISLAECYEMIDKAIYIHHKAVMNFPMDRFSNENENTRYYNDELNQTKHNFQTLTEDQMQLCSKINNGNKLSVLGGDYLFSFGIIRLAELVSNSQAFDFVGAAIDDYVINQFDSKNSQDDDLVDKSLPWCSVKLADYEQCSGHGANSLLAYCLQFNAILSDLSSIRFEKSSFELGLNLRLKWNVAEDLKWLQNESDTGMRLFSLPIVLYIINNPEYASYLKNSLHSQTLNIGDVKATVDRPEIRSECNRLMRLYQKRALDSVKIFPQNSNRDLLEKIICL